MPIKIFDFYGHGVRIESSNEELLERLTKDFEHFENPSSSSPLCVAIRAEQSIPTPLPTPSRAKRGRNCLRLDRGSLRHNDYFGEASVLYDFKKDVAEIRSLNLERLHEICYLLIQSRAGKKLDRDGWHRIHAMAAVANGRTFLCSMASGGGKSSLLLELMRDPETKWLSDDCPLVSRSGEIKAFPLRIGLTESWLQSEIDHPAIRREYLYRLHRMRFGIKNLIPKRGVRNSVGPAAEGETVLILGERVSSGAPEVRAIGAWRFLPLLFRNLVIGEGLAMLREYFLEPGPRDFFRLARIAFSRSRAALSLLFRARLICLKLTPDSTANVAALKAFFEEKKA